MIHIRTVPLLSLLAVASLGTAADTPPNLRLAEVQDAGPVRYQAQLTLDPSQAAFQGTIQISLDIRKPLQTLWLNAHQIKVQSATFTMNGRALTAKVVPGGNDFLGFELLCCSGRQSIA